MKKIISVFNLIEWEAVLWLSGLIFLMFVNPYQSQQLSLCPFHNLGISFCPGCGLGRSISFLYHGDFLHSIKAHPLGIFAILLITARIIKLTRKMIRNVQKQKEVLYG